jgi:hypothetical protein
MLTTFLREKLKTKDHSGNPAYMKDMKGNIKIQLKK